MPTLRGTVSWQGPTVAELWDENVWKVRINGEPDPLLERNLTILYADRILYGGPSDGFYGYAILRDLANMMGGRFRFIKPPDVDDGRIY
jgi:hypothetical protein